LYKFRLLDVQLINLFTRSACDQLAPAFMAVFPTNFDTTALKFSLRTLLAFYCPQQFVQQYPYNPDAVCCRRNVPQWQGTP